MFQEYCNNIDNARLRIESCMKLETFKRAFRKCQEDQRAKGLNLQNWLMRPNQPLMRQPLLLEALLKNTPKEHPDHDRLLQGLNKAKEIHFNAVANGTFSHTLITSALPSPPLRRT